MAKMDERVQLLEERIDWHKKVGWGTAALIGTGFILLLTWYLPKELSSLRDLVKSDTATQVQTVKTDTAAQLEPVKVELARLSALMELAKTKDVAKVLQQSLSHENPGVAVQTAAAVAKQAREDGLKTAPSELAHASDRIQDIAKGDPNIQSVAWYARLELVGYRTVLNKGEGLGPKAVSPVFKFPGMVMNGGHLIGGGKQATQPLDNAYWRNYVFENLIIMYEGGPMALENVVFINCTFQMAPTPRAEKLANTLLADNRVTEAFQ